MLKIGDKVTVLPDPNNPENPETGLVGEIVEVADNGDDWEVHIESDGDYNGKTYSFKDGELALQPAPQPALTVVSEPERHWYHDETFVDALMTGWLDKLAGSIDGMANAIHRQADALERLAQAEENRNRLL